VQLAETKLDTLCACLQDGHDLSCMELWNRWTAL